MTLYSHLFYDNNLVCQTPRVVWEEMLGWEKLRRGAEGERKKEVVPILFHHVNGQERRDRDSPSWYNQQEIDLVLNFLKSLIAGEGVEKVAGKDVGVICPYRKQVEKMRAGVRNTVGVELAEKIEVGTTEFFQVFISLF